MAYKDQEPRVFRILEALKDVALTIQPTDYWTRVKDARVFDTEKVVLGAQVPKPFVAVVPTDDFLHRAYTCNVVERHMTVDLLGCLSVIPSSDKWKLDSYRLASDLQRAVKLDQKLPTSENPGGEALWIDVVGSEVYDQVDQGLALAHVTFRVAYRHAIDDPSS